MKERADKASITIRSLETLNEELKVKVRQLEFSTNDLTMKLEDAEEAMILLRENAEEGKSSRRHNTYYIISNSCLDQGGVEVAVTRQG